MVWTTSMLLGVYMWHWGTLWPVLTVMAGWVAPLVHIGKGVKRIQIYQRTLSSISDVIWMSMVDFRLRLVFCVLESVCHALYMSCFVWTRPFFLLLCNACMVSYQSINQSILI